MIGISNTSRTSENSILIEITKIVVANRSVIDSDLLGSQQDLLSLNKIT